MVTATVLNFHILNHTLLIALSTSPLLPTLRSKFLLKFVCSGGLPKLTLAAGPN